MNKNRVMNLGDYGFIRGNIPEVKRKVKVEVRRKDGRNIDIIEMNELEKEDEIQRLGEGIINEYSKKGKKVKVDVGLEERDGKILIRYQIIEEDNNKNRDAN